MSTNTQSTAQPSRTCFVTIGATAAFSELIRAVLTPTFCSALKSQNFTHLIIQYGQDGSRLFSETLATANNQAGNLEISGFDIDSAGLSKYMRQCQADERTNTAEGVVISHAGSGTVLDALRLSVPLIVIPNPTLLDNHQVELAEALAQQEYAVHGKLSDLSGALKESEKLASRSQKWPPVNSGTHRRAKGLKGVIDEEMGYLD